MQSSSAVIEDTVEVGKGNFVPVSILKAEGAKTMADKKGGGGGFNPPARMVSAAWYLIGGLVLIWVVLLAGTWLFTQIACTISSDGEYCTSRRAEAAAEAAASAARRASLLETTVQPPSYQRRNLTIGSELNRRMHGGPQLQRRQPVVVQGVDRTPPPCAGTLRRNEADNAWVCRVYHD